jgi:hypothetical protein
MKNLSKASDLQKHHYTLLNELDTYKIIKPTRKISSAQLYTINPESKTSGPLMTFPKEFGK